jgi:hypothetical protein
LSAKIVWTIKWEGFTIVNAFIADRMATIIDELIFYINFGSA